ncbi:PKD domain-containing protein, partial [Luteibaculum oceani]
VNKIPSANVSVPTEACINAPVPFSATSSENVQISWDYGDGTQLEFGPKRSHRFVSSGRFTVTTTVLNKTTGCINSYRNDIEIQDIPTPDFTIDGLLDFNTTLCDNDRVRIAMVNQDLGTTYNWYINDVLQSPFIPNFNLSLLGGNKTIRLEAVTSAGCFASIEKTIKVAIPTAKIESVNEVCNRSDLAMKFTSGINVDQFQWQIIGNGVDTRSTNPAVYPVNEPSGTNFLTLNLELTTKEGCVNNISKSIRVKQVLAGFFAPSEV